MENFPPVSWYMKQNTHKITSELTSEVYWFAWHWSCQLLWLCVCTLYLVYILQLVYILYTGNKLNFPIKQNEIHILQFHVFFCIFFLQDIIKKTLSFIPSFLFLHVLNNWNEKYYSFMNLLYYLTMHSLRSGRYIYQYLCTLWWL